MPLNLDNTVPLDAVIDAIEIDSFAVDLDRSEMVVGYTKLASGQPVQQSVHIISGLDFAASISRSNAIANAMPAGSVNVYGAIKLALYEALTAATGLTGTVA